MLVEARVCAEDKLLTGFDEAGTGFDEDLTRRVLDLTRWARSKIVKTTITIDLHSRLI